MFYYFSKFKNYLLVVFSCFLTSALFAQSKSEPRSAGIEFRNFDSWQAALDVSKKENKPIFVDFFTTWCGPCKNMEKEVYPDSAVAAYFNKNLISIKVQMDQTNKDAEQVKKWYGEAKMLEKRYEINAYPVLLFLSSSGEILNRFEGFQKPKDFIETAQIALKPGQKYVRPGAIYYDKIDAFKAGKISGNELVKLLNSLVHDQANYFPKRDEVLDTLISTCMEYFRTQPLASLYKKDVLEIISRVAPKPSDPLFKLFYPNTAKVDKVVGQVGVARLVVDRAIKREFFNGVFDKVEKEPNKEINWDSLYQVVKSKYNADYAKRSVDAAKTIYYCFKSDKANYPQSMIDLIQKHGQLSILLSYNAFAPGWLKRMEHNSLVALAVNAFCWMHIFGYTTKPEQLNAGIAMMKDAIDYAEKHQPVSYAMYADTYANLLYKVGNRDKAMEIEAKVIASAKLHKYSENDVKVFEEVLNKMKAGTPTWYVEKK